MRKIGIIMVAHGSKRRESNEEFALLVAQVREKNTKEFQAVKHAFLESATPSIEESIAQMCTEDIEEIYVYPYFLNSGKHVAVDIPDIIMQMQESCKDVKIQLMTHFGQSQSISSIISSDLQTIL